MRELVAGRGRVFCAVCGLVWHRMTHKPGRGACALPMIGRVSGDQPEGLW